MARRITSGWLIVLAIVNSAAANEPAPQRGLTEVDHAQVELRDGFWGPRLQRHSEVTIAHALNKLEEDGHVTNFDKAAGKFAGPLKGHHAFDSDLHKALEGAYCSLQHFPDATIRQRSDDICRRIIAAQQPDGFLISYYIVNGLDKRWDDLRLEHQLYNAGHFFEMAVAQQQLTQRPEVMAAAKRFADHIANTFGEGKRYDVDGHPEVELALVRLYRATGERRYLELARFFIDERGYAHGTERKPFDASTVKMPEKPEGTLTEEQRREYRRAVNRVRNGRMQDHKPLAAQEEAVGHAVRAGYIFAAMTDIARFMDAPAYERASRQLAQDVAKCKLYITGGIGTAQYHDEGFGDPYLLPNDSAYTESCAAIAYALWQHRLALLTGESRYADVLELALYNSVLSGISLSGDRFFYQNPLASGNGAQRSKWIGLSCCPTNLARIIPQVGGLAYATSRDGIYVNLYVAGAATIRTATGAQVKLTQRTEYPWDGQVQIEVTPDKAAEFELALRIPGWAQGQPVPSDLYKFAASEVAPVQLQVNDQAVDAKSGKDGYVHLRRRWQAGDKVTLNLPMPVQRVRAHENVKADTGKVALMRGPVVYCLEAVDHSGADLASLALAPTSALQTQRRPDLLSGVTVITGNLHVAGQAAPVPLLAIPYYAWANRERCGMTVWINEAP